MLDSGCNGFFLPLLASCLFSSTAPGFLLSLCSSRGPSPFGDGPVPSWATHDWSPSGVSLLWHGSSMGHSPLKGALALSQSTSFQECISSCVPSSVPFLTSPLVSPQECPHISPQVSPHVSLPSLSFHPFLNTSKDHVFLWLAAVLGHSVVFPDTAKSSRTGRDLLRQFLPPPTQVTRWPQLHTPHQVCQMQP